MRILKSVIKCLAMLSLAVTVVTGELIPAILLLVFSSVSLGILIGQKTECGGKKYE